MEEKAGLTKKEIIQLIKDLGFPVVFNYGCYTKKELTYLYIRAILENEKINDYEKSEYLISLLVVD